MTSELLITILTEHGPWVLLVFYLLYRDFQKDQATRDVVNKNSVVLIERKRLVWLPCLKPQMSDSVHDR